MPNNTPIRVAVALIIQDGHVLMGQRRAEKLYPFHWEFPGGKLEHGETTAVALSRELQEELGIDATVDEIYVTEVATYSNGATYDITYHVVRQFHGPITNTEFADIGWFTIQELPQLQHLSGNAAILAQLYRDGFPA